VEANAPSLELAESDEGFLRVSETSQLRHQTSSANADASGPDATMELQINIGKPVEVAIELRARPLSTRAILSGHHRFGMVYLA
jgi:hypothetical protein